MGNYEYLKPYIQTDEEIAAFLVSAAGHHSGILEQWRKGIFTEAYTERRLLTEEWLRRYGDNVETVDIDPLDKPFWLEARKGHLGASDLPTLLRLNSEYGSPLTLYKEKTGQSTDKSCFWDEDYPRPEGDSSPSMAALWGNRAEEFVAEQARALLGIWSFSPHCQFRVSDHIVVTPDRLVMARNAIVQIKTTSPYKQDMWGVDIYDVPENYYCQEQAEMAAFPEMEEALVWAFVWGNSLKVRIVPKDAEYQEAIVNTARHFWLDHVEMKTPPEPSCRVDFKEILKEARLTEKRVETRVDALMDELIDTFLEAQQRKKEADEDQEVLKAKILKEMADLSVLITDKYRCSLTERKGNASGDENALKMLSPNVYQETLQVNWTDVRTKHPEAYEMVGKDNPSSYFLKPTKIKKR